MVHVDRVEGHPTDHELVVRLHFHRDLEGHARASSGGGEI
jgi:hypothetical protein